MEMESTKKRTGLEMEEGNQEEESNDGSRRSTSPEPARKKKKIDPAQQMQTLFDFLRRYRREDGSELCETFIRAPKRRTEPGYYEVVTDPIDMLRIQQKLKMDEYGNMEELKEDFGKLLKNALSYYKKGSQEFKDAVELQDLFVKAAAKVEAGEDPSATLGNREESDENDMAEMLEDLFASVMTLMDTTDPERPLHLMFRLLPSQKRYPEYYKVITEPIDLKIIAGKIVDNKYEDLTQLEDDIGQMCKNAQMFNEPGSQIYRDARVIMKTVKQKKFELEAARVARENRGSRSRSRAPIKKRYATDVANMQYEDSESEESSEGEEGIDKEDPLWALFSYIRYYKTNSGNALAEPFLTLPSKRELPDYYMTIANPISLNNIRKKLKGNEYNGDSATLYADLNLMFENCKTYNRPDSRLYKDACKMQRLLKNKYEDLESESEEESSEEEEDIDDPKRILYNTLLKYENNAGINIIGMFMQKPSKKDYPDYYEVINHPIDMTMINEKIKKSMYKSTENFIQDCRLMFNNCRQYNEEGSEIVKDANTLERRLYLKAKELGINMAVGVGGQIGRPRKSGVPVVNKKAIADRIKKLVDTIKDFRDPKGRQLALIFLMLPNIKEFPDYYQVIKNPIDLNKIGSKVRQGAYVTLEECQSDLMLMFDNACKYNEPDSQIYKDALTLQNVVVRTAKTLAEEDLDESAVPNVTEAVQEILSHIFSQMYNQQDSDERCYSDSLAELPEHNEVNGKKVRALNLDLIKRRLDRGLYKRLDDFQRDIFSVLDRARNLSRTDSQVFEDSVELQTHFIRIRDEACGHGEILQSRALLYTQSDLLKSVEEVKAIKQESEAPEDDNETKEGNMDPDGKSSHTFNQQQYHVGDFVFVETSKEKGSLPSIFLIENIHAIAGEQMIYGNQFFRPIETFHVHTRKFLENEVFRSNEYKDLAFNDIVGRCFVMNVKDYFTKKPEGFEDKDIFVCESRYSAKSRSFKKIKLFWNVPDHIPLMKREEVLEPKRVMSVFKERIEKHKVELEELENMETTLETQIPPNIIWENPETVQGHEAGSVYYEQYTIPGPITLRRGDAVFVRAETGKNLIAQIDAMWTAADGMAYFHGPWFVTPKETPHPPSQMFYPREAFISTIQDTNPLLSVVGRCCILEMEDYVKSRPTQYDEEDVYICDNVYDESRRIIRGLPPTGLKRYEYNSTQVMADEVYYFKKAIKPQKETSVVNLPKAEHQSSMMDVDNEDSMDAPSVGSTDTPVVSTPARKVKRGGNKNVTPYIIYASEIRKAVTDANKGASFGEISKIVGDQWRGLSDTDKAHYEAKAKKMNEENAIKAAEEKKLEEQRALLEQQNAARAGQMQSMNSLGSALMSGGNVMNTPQAPRGLTSMSPAPQQLSRPPSQNAAPMKQVEPIFHTVPPRPQRLLHSEAYIRYIEALTTESNQMSNWEKQLKANRELVKCPDEARLPAHWLANNGDHNTSLDALWALRDFLTCDSLGVTRIVQGPL